jgi:hypothetical protein
MISADPRVQFGNLASEYHEQIGSWRIASTSTLLAYEVRFAGSCLSRVVYVKLMATDLKLTASVTVRPGQSAEN